MGVGASSNEFRVSMDEGFREALFRPHRVSMRFSMCQRNVYMHRDSRTAELISGNEYEYKFGRFDSVSVAFK